MDFICEALALGGALKSRFHRLGDDDAELRVVTLWRKPLRSHRLRTAGPNGDGGDGMTAEFLPSRLRIIQAPMAGSQGVELCVSVSEAGGLGSLPTAMLSPTELRDQIAAIRTRTHAPFNVNFFCHMHPRPNPEGQARWLDELARDYAEAALDPTAAKYGPGRAPFDPAMAEVIEEAKPAVVSFHFGLPHESLLAPVKHTGAKIYSSATTVAEARWLEDHAVDANHRPGRRGGRPSRNVFDRGHRGPARPVCAPASGRRRSPRSGDRGGRYCGRTRNSGSLHAGRRRRANRHRIPFDATICNFGHTPCGAPLGAR